MHEFLAVQHRHAKPALRQLKRNGPAYNPAADYDYIVGFHTNILSAIRYKEDSPGRRSLFAGLIGAGSALDVLGRSRLSEPKSTG